MAPGLKPSHGWCQWLHVQPGVVVGVPDINVSQELVMATPSHVAQLAPPHLFRRSWTGHLVAKGRSIILWERLAFDFLNLLQKKCCDAKASQVSPVNSPDILAGTFWVFMTGLVMATSPGGTLPSSRIPETTWHSWKLVKKIYKKRSWNGYQVPEISNFFQQNSTKLSNGKSLKIDLRFEDESTATSLIQPNPFSPSPFPSGPELCTSLVEVSSQSIFEFSGSHEEVIRGLPLRGLFETQSQESLASGGHLRHLLSQVGSNPKRICKQMWQKKASQHNANLLKKDCLQSQIVSGEGGTMPACQKNKLMFESKVLLWLLIVVYITFLAGP